MSVIFKVLLLCCIHKHLRNEKERKEANIFYSLLELDISDVEKETKAGYFINLFLNSSAGLDRLLFLYTIN